MIVLGQLPRIITGDYGKSRKIRGYRKSQIYASRVFGEHLFEHSGSTDWEITRYLQEIRGNSQEIMGYFGTK